MKPILTLEVLISVFIFSSCTEQPEIEEMPLDTTMPKAVFSSYLRSEFCGTPPATFFFSNYSTNASNYIWDFGDGTSSFEREPIKTYENAGIYKVSLIANFNGRRDTTQQQVYVLSNRNELGPTVDFTYEKDPKSYHVIFIAKCKNASLFSWSGGGLSTSDSLWVQTFPGPGIYAITLTAFNEDASNCITKLIPLSPL